MEQKQWHSMTVAEVSKDLRVSNEGLTNQEAEGRLIEFGPNELQVEKQVSPLQIFIGQFKSILIIILFFATIFSAVIGEIIDAIIIFAIVIASAGLGFFQEYRAERALEALKKMLSPAITVVRDGKEKSRILRGQPGGTHSGNDRGQVGDRFDHYEKRQRYLRRRASDPAVYKRSAGTIHKNRLGRSSCPHLSTV